MNFVSPCDCEKRSDEAIQLDCADCHGSAAKSAVAPAAAVGFAALGMTARMPC